MRVWKVVLTGALAGGLWLATGCGRQSALPGKAAGVATASGDEQLPFDREGQKVGISPTSTVIPPGARIPAGTPITVRVEDAISSARAKSGDIFHAELDEPIIVNGQAVAERGAIVTGRILESAPARSASSPGYVRLTLTSIVIGGNPSPVQTSSSFVKGQHSATLEAPPGSDERSTLRGAAVNAENDAPPVLAAAKNAAVDPDSRLAFRLMESVPLRPQDPQ